MDYVSLNVPETCREARQMMFDFFDHRNEDGSDLPDQLDFLAPVTRLEPALEIINRLSWCYNVTGAAKDWSGDWRVSFKKK